MILSRIFSRRRRRMDVTPEPFEKTLDRLLDGRRYRRLEKAERAKKGHRTRSERAIMNDPLVKQMLAFNGKTVVNGMTSDQKRTLRLRIMARDGNVCCYCPQVLQIETPGAKDYGTLEHVHPVAFGGSNAFSNLKLSCLSCNSKRGGKTLYVRRLVMNAAAKIEAGIPSKSADLNTQTEVL